MLMFEPMARSNQLSGAKMDTKEIETVGFWAVVAACTLLAVGGFTLLFLPDVSSFDGLMLFIISLSGITFSLVYLIVKRTLFSKWVLACAAAGLIISLIILI